MTEVFARIKQIAGQEHIDPLQTEIGSMVYAVKPGDGSAREQAASCQRVIGGLANIAEEYATNLPLQGAGHLLNHEYERLRANVIPPFWNVVYLDNSPLKRK